jgi:hypothetical protein
MLDRSKDHDGRSSSLHLTRLISSPITRIRTLKSSGICCVVFFDRSPAKPSSRLASRCFFDTAVVSRVVSYILPGRRLVPTFQTGSDSESERSLKLRRPLLTTLLTLCPADAARWIEWCEWIKYLISVTRCMSTSVIPSASSLLPTSSSFGSCWDSVDDRNETEFMDFATDCASEE